MSRTTVVAALAAGVLLVAGCSSDEPAPAPSSSGGAATADAGQDHDYTVEGFASSVLGDGTLDDLEDVGSASGEIEGGQVEAQIVSVVADAAGTELVVVLRGDDTGSPSRWSESRGVFTDVRGVEVVDEAAGWRLQPYTILDVSGESDLGCACSEFPYRLGEDGTVVQALLPPLTEGTTSVTVALPGLEPVPGVAVTWR
ncbi:hypothetical protein [Cellulomonas sp. B6]|jgi:hypothetical protein|uniref:hypothetical protein n=1 Tax=Cellulomonas sp. B6 TaxID=1295626 RepID=UPI00073C56C7|nr:hypothetical protein [Cellulomonas sp. B6]KSW29357.1 hypothetical protein ATM99_08430 [Cellulomonas sp. B6]